MNLGSFVKCMFLNMSIFKILIIIIFFEKFEFRLHVGVFNIYYL